MGSFTRRPSQFQPVDLYFILQMRHRDPRPRSDPRRPDAGLLQRKVYDPPLARYAAVTIGPDRNCPFVCIQAALPTYSKGAEALKYGAVDGTAG